VKPPKVLNQHCGTLGEQEAKQFLTEQGYHIIAQNWRYGRYGELDLVAITPAPAPHVVCFIEVKTRTSRRFGMAEEAISSKKQQTMLLLAEAYLMANPQWANHHIRFDVIAIQPKGAGMESPSTPLGAFELTFYPNAFDGSQ
jgi:putative endonuclease